MSQDVVTFTCSTPHGLKRGDVLTTHTGSTYIVRRVSDKYTAVATPPRWYERFVWWLVTKWAQFRAWWTWKRTERRLRKGLPPEDT